MCALIPILYWVKKRAANISADPSHSGHNRFQVTESELSLIIDSLFLVLMNTLQP